MIKRPSKRTKTAKLQSNDANFVALTALISNASGVSALGQKLIAMADQITEGAGVLAERTGHTVEDVCLRMLTPGRARGRTKQQGGTARR